MPLGPQGCAYLHGLVVNGPFKGRVINLEKSAELKPSPMKTTFWIGMKDGWIKLYRANSFQIHPVGLVMQTKTE
ncbi:unnamed protein product, partial [Ectocarpus sp. 12 AP-2014]